MLGLAKPRRRDQPIAISLEDLIPHDHFYRHLENTLDLSFVRDWTRERYAERGRPSIDPWSSSSSSSSCSSRASVPRESSCAWSVIASVCAGMLATG
jgi:hypothetical protein